MPPTFPQPMTPQEEARRNNICHMIDVFRMMADNLENWGGVPLEIIGGPTSLNTMHLGITNSCVVMLETDIELGFT